MKSKSKKEARKEIDSVKIQDNLSFEETAREVIEKNRPLLKRFAEYSGTDPYTTSLEKRLETLLQENQKLKEAAREALKCFGNPPRERGWMRPLMEKLEKALGGEG